MSEFLTKLRKIFSNAFTSDNNHDFTSSRYLSTESSRGYPIKFDFSIENFKKEKDSTCKQPKGRFENIKTFGEIEIDRKHHVPMTVELGNLNRREQARSRDENVLKAFQASANILNSKNLSATESINDYTSRLNTLIESHCPLSSMSSERVSTVNSFGVTTKANLNSNSRIKKEIEIFSRSLKEGLSPHSYLNRPQAYLNRPEFEVKALDYLTISPTRKTALSNSRRIIPSIKPETLNYLSFTGKNSLKNVNEAGRLFGPMENTLRKVSSKMTQKENEMDEFGRGFKYGSKHVSTFTGNFFSGKNQSMGGVFLGEGKKGGGVR